MITIFPQPFVHAKNSWFVPYWCTVGLRVTFFNESVRRKPPKRNIYLVRESSWSIIATRISSKYSSGVFLWSFSASERWISWRFPSFLPPISMDYALRVWKGFLPGLFTSLLIQYGEGTGIFQASCDSPWCRAKRKIHIDIAPWIPYNIKAVHIRSA